MKEIQLTQGKIAMVDDEDFEWLNRFKWCATKIGNIFYAKRGAYIKETQGTKILYMHREIFGTTNSKHKIDHRDNNGLNNQRSNLRVASHSQNIAHMLNRSKGTSKYLGVSWNKKRKKWDAELTKNYIKIHLGGFDNEEHAALAYDQAAKKYHGEFASLNII